MFNVIEIIVLFVYQVTSSCGKKSKNITIRLIAALIPSNSM